MNNSERYSGTWPFSDLYSIVAVSLVIIQGQLNGWRNNLMVGPVRLKTTLKLLRIALPSTKYQVAA